jgi:hypothetical protein
MWRTTVCAALIASAFFCTNALSRGGPREGNSQEVTKWFQEKAVMTPKAQEMFRAEFEALEQAQFEYPQREITPQEREWMNKQHSTDEARKKGIVPWYSCCSHADRVKTRFFVDKTTGKDRWKYLDPNTGQWVEIPNEVIHEEYDPNMPETLRREGVLFVYSGKVTCFWVPEGGI